MASRTTSRALPKLACEIALDRVVAARTANQSALDAATSRRLPAGTVTAGLNPPNVLQGEAVKQAIAGSLSAIGGGPRARDVVAILPDAAVRVLLVEFDALPDKFEEAAPIIRFRVKKSLPFDVEEAALSYQARRNGNVKVVAALSPKKVIEEFESAFHNAGYIP